MTNAIVYDEDFYRIELLDEEERYTHTTDEGEEIIVSYVLVHNIYETVEYQSDKLPVILSIADNFNHLLNTEGWKTHKAKSSGQEALGELLRIDPEDDDEVH